MEWGYGELSVDSPPKSQSLTSNRNRQWIAAISFLQPQHHRCHFQFHHSQMLLRRVQRMVYCFLFAFALNAGTIDACAQPLATQWLVLFILQISNGFAVIVGNQFECEHHATTSSQLGKFGHAQKSPFFISRKFNVFVCVHKNSRCLSEFFCACGNYIYLDLDRSIKNIK